MEKLLVTPPRKPFYRELQAGQRVLWCSCGQSKRQPFCDGRSHEGTGFLPLPYQAAREEEVLLCGCKQTCTPPFCDGAHANLPGGYADEVADPQQPDIAYAVADAAGFKRLDGTCYVVSPPAAAGTEPWSCTTLVGPEFGAQHMSQFHFRLQAGTSPVFASTTGDVALYIRDGDGEISIGGRSFPARRGSGVAIRRGETFRLTASGAPLEIYASVCPGAGGLAEGGTMSDAFDTAWPDRVVGIDQESRHAMGPRWFQMLVDERHGLNNTAQFIGHIPQSRAAMHRHLYEESVIILAGSGTIWNETSRARVDPGDVIFFPRKHVHSLQCTADDGMDVVGLIHPGTNPGINY